MVDWSLPADRCVTFRSSILIFIIIHCRRSSCAELQLANVSFDRLYKFLMGQSRPLFVYFRLFDTTQINKN